MVSVMRRNNTLTVKANSLSLAIAAMFLFLLEVVSLTVRRQKYF